MKKIVKVSVSILLMFAVMLSSVLFASPAFAKDNKDDLTPAKKSEIGKELGIDDYDDEEGGDPYETGIGVHADPATFEKDFGLTFAQKEYTIKEIQRVVSEIIDPQMSDLEKYYTLAIWVNKHVEYDWKFWSGRYYFEYYSHQWDCYGGMKEEEKSVCAGIAIFYAAMCHAADLPCKYLRLDPKHLDHTINYIPDINGHAYLVDVTENVFLMSEKSGSAFTNLDKEFSHITKDADDETFDYYRINQYYDDEDEEMEEDNMPTASSTIKDFYDVPFETWFNEYALHNDTDKVFRANYEELGSGVTGQHYAAYRDYDSNRTEHPDIWFMDDFYADPADVSAKILAGELDEQITDVSGVKKSYVCDTTEDLEEFVKRDITIKCFPSLEDGKIVAKTATLEKDKDYTITLESFDAQTSTAQFVVNGIGAYNGTKTIEVKANRAVVEKVPTAKIGLVYNESAQQLVEPGEGCCGEMQYALGTETEPTEEFSTVIPSAINAGDYYVWYKVVGDEVCGSTQPERIARVATLSPFKPEIIQDDITIKEGQTVKLNPVINNGMKAKFSYFTLGESTIEIDKNGNLTGLHEGEASIGIDAQLLTDNLNYETPEWIYITVNVLHSHSYAKTVVVAPKANAVGYARYKCSCGEWKKDAAGKVVQTYIAPTGKPAGFKCNARTAQAMRFTWNKTSGVTGYQVQILNSKGGNAGLKTLAGNTYTFTKLSAGYAYKARVRFYIKAADGKNYFGAWSTIVSPTLPKGTSLVKLTGASKAFSAQWNKGAVTGYQLQYSTNAKFSGAKLKALKGASKVSLKVGSLKGGTKYFVRVRTFKTIGGKHYYSTWSATKSTKTK